MKLQDLKDELSFIAAPGAFGGFISWVLSTARVDGRLVHVWVDMPLFVVLGAAAGLTFVVLLSNTNREDTIRVVVLSFLAGLAWQPIISGGMNLVSGDEDSASLGAHVEAFRDLQEVVSGREAADSTEKKAAAEALTAEVLDRVPSADNLRPSQRQTLSELYSGLVGQLPGTQAQTFRDRLQRRGIDLDEDSGAATGRYFEDAVEANVPNTLSDVPDPDTLVSVGPVASPVSVTSQGNATWVMVHIPILEEDDYVIEVASDEGDLVAFLYDQFGLLAAGDDDSAGGRNPRLNVNLFPGPYFLRVSIFTGGVVPSFEVRVRR